MKLSVDEIARVCHEANRALCIALDDRVLPEWDEISNETQGITVRAVRYILNQPYTPTLADIHERWRVDKMMHGWSYGEVTDDVRKTHRNMMAYVDLPTEQKAKDSLFLNIVVTLSGLT